MLTYIVRRLLLMVPTLLGVTAVVFFVMAYAPGGFAGLNLGVEGAMKEGDQARRIREYNARRYGIDQPPIVQYGRWLNQVSPIGFMTSGKITFTEDDFAAASRTLETSSQADLVREFGQRRAVTVLASLAAYHDWSLDRAAQQLIQALDQPRQGVAIITDIQKLDDKWAASFQKALAGDDPAPARALLLEELNNVLAFRERIHFHRPVFKWPDLGTSLRGRPVTSLLREAVPVTLLLNLLTLPIIYGIAIPVGVLAARYRGKAFDVSSGMVMLALWSIPTIWIGVLLIGLLANVQFVRWFPTGNLHDLQAANMSFLPRWGAQGFERGYLLDTAWHLVLPVICMSTGFAVLSKLMRGSVLDNIASDYVRTARAKGLSDNDVLFRHVFRNSLLPLITVASGIIPTLIAGSLIIENIFSLPGMGKLGMEAAFMKDRELVMATTLVAGLIGLMAELLRDVLYAVADPRVSYE
jgi:peptide/nickel transport system permease protein